MRALVDTNSLHAARIGLAASAKADTLVRLYILMNTPG